MQEKIHLGAKIVSECILNAKNEFLNWNWGILKCRIAI